MTQFQIKRLKSPKSVSIIFKTTHRQPLYIDIKRTIKLFTFTIKWFQERSLRTVRHFLTADGVVLLFIVLHLVAFSNSVPESRNKMMVEHHTHSSAGSRREWNHTGGSGMIEL